MQEASYYTGFARRHIGPSSEEQNQMLKELGFLNLDSMSKAIVPENIIDHDLVELKDPATESEALTELEELVQKNELKKSLIGMGYYNTFTPPVIGRLILENPGWYTQYTPYQAEISQGRLESLLNFQTMVSDLTGLPVANASLLDEGTAAAEFMFLAYGSKKRSDDRPFAVSNQCHPHVIEVLQNRANALDISLSIFDTGDGVLPDCFGVILPYPCTNGKVEDPSSFIADAKSKESLVGISCDLLSLTLLKSPGDLGADVAFGNSQRFGVPFGFGGPHAAFFACSDALKRKVPGRIVGVSIDREGKPAYRLALQTREQHIRREKATSNICTAQALLANMAAMYAVYHGPEGLKSIALTVHSKAKALASVLISSGYKLTSSSFFDTIEVNTEDAFKICAEANLLGYNLRKSSANQVGISVDETTTIDDLAAILRAFSIEESQIVTLLNNKLERPASFQGEDSLIRTSKYMEHEVFHRYQSETELTRYIKRLEYKDLSLTHSMIPLGSCTMKLNSVSELAPISWKQIKDLHPFAPLEQTRGLRGMISQLEDQLAILTGFDKVSTQPNSGAQGELAGLLTIKKYLQQKGEGHRKVCLIPSSAHGTNPASAVLVGFTVKIIKCDQNGNVDLDDLASKLATHGKNVAAIMITYPSTHGVFEKSIRDICNQVHEVGGQVYMDGANLNAQLGLCRPGNYGADVAHLNLHKTFCIPHGGGGPGVGPIGVVKHLAPFLPSHSFLESDQVSSAVTSAPFGSAGILPISWMYIRMMGAEALKRATQVAILNANYIAKRLEGAYTILYKSTEGHVAHECILDMRSFKKSAGIEVEDIAKRLMDYGYHAPTISWPVPGTMMIEPTESESKKELDRFCDAMLAIRDEISQIESGAMDQKNNLLKNAPHTAYDCITGGWDKPYSREKASFPLPHVKAAKFWPPVSRIDNAHGDRNFVCSCPPLEDYE